jgi:hypothetical protein
MKRIINLKLTVAGDRNRIPSTDQVKRSVSGAGYGYNAGVGYNVAPTVEVKSTTEGNLPPAVAARTPETAHGLVEAILSRVAPGRALDSTTAAQIRDLATKAKAALGSPSR